MKDPLKRVIHGLLFVSLAFVLSLVAYGDPSSLVDRTHEQPMRFIQPQDFGITADNLYAKSLAAWPNKTPAISEDITINQFVYDQTVLTKFIPASAFIPNNLSGELHDGFRYDSGGCIRPTTDLSSLNSEGRAPVELPDNALLLNVVLWAYDNDAYSFVGINLAVMEDIQSFYFTESAPGVLVPHFENAISILASGSTNTVGVPAPGWGGFTLEIDPDEVMGLSLASGPPPFGLTLLRKFLSLWVTMANAGGDNLVVCGAEVHYKVPATGSNQVLTPLTPCRFFDSRPNNGGTGKFSANEIRTVWTTGDTTIQGGVGNCGIPSYASALQLSFVVVEPDGTGSLKLWAPNVAEPQGVLAFTTSSTFWNGSGVVPIAAEPGEQTGQPRLRIKTNGSGAHLYLAVTGYYSSVSNMGN